MEHSDGARDHTTGGAASTELLALLDYTAWATERLLNALHPLTPEELARDLGSSHGGVSGTLEHLYGSDVIWTARLCERPAIRFSDLPPLPPLEVLKPQWLALQTGRRDFVAGLHPEQGTGYANLKGEAQSNTVGEIVRHLVNHSAYHRGQVVTLLRQLGHPAPNTDLIAFYRLPPLTRQVGSQ
ncbi:DinB family protein [Deinococcus altitudinis]|uniref:DinB family protein n=1 Tax=Deinococcus altitudinis TaxID=468914 RepID=UPI003891825A